MKSGLCQNESNRVLVSSCVREFVTKVPRCMKNYETCTALILAAGASSRMGQPKALLKLSSGRTLLEDQCRRVLEAGVENIYVVVGCHADRIVNEHTSTRAHERTKEIIWVVNKNWESGRFSSIQCGVKKIGDAPILLLPIDVVDVPVDIIQQIINEGLSSQSNIVPTFEGKGGHPVFLCGETLKTILETPVEEGRLNEILRRGVTPYAPTRRVEVASKNILNNVNTWEEWEGILK